ncbi:piezo-type mechanosensitive ion channel component 1-like, partial [Tachysurus ichikawai]
MDARDSGVHVYNHQDLINYRNRVTTNLHDDVLDRLRDLGLLRRPGLQSPVSPDTGDQERGRRKRCARKRKRGKRAGVRARLKTNPSRPALPSILLANVCSLDNKLDYIRLERSTRREIRNCCVFVFTETWLSDRVPDTAIQLDGLTSFRADRNAALCGKTHGGGVCVYINTEWCKNSVLVSTYCSSSVEFVTVRCRPFYLPREFTTVYIVGVYIPPSANAKEVLSELYGAISDLQNVHPDGLFIVAGDFNHANLKSVLPKFHQHVDFATRGENTLDLVYTNIPSAYRAEPRPHLGYSDHITVMLIPAYRPLVRRSKPVLKQVKTWPAGATSALQDCFECTDWNIFREAATNGDSVNLEEYTSAVTSYIGKCINDVTVSKTITTRSNQKPWMTANVRALLRTRDLAFRTGDRAALRTEKAKLSRAIREANRAHAQTIHSHFQDSGDTRRMWQGIQAITNYKTASPACDSNASLPDALNDFYARFEVQNKVTARKTIPPPDDQVLCLSTADVRRSLCRVNPRKAAGPDNIPGRVLRECAEQLADVFTDIFNISLSSAVVPTCLKTTTIVPVPKKSTVSCLNDYRPVALTPIVMKCFEKLVMRHIKTQLPPSLDPLQFAYRPNRSTDDAIATALHLALTHLDNKDTYVRMLFIDFSSAFNTIIPQHLIGKLSLLGLNTSLCNWILDFLTGRP